MTERKPHVSPSQLESLSRCGEAYRRRYVEGEKVPPGIAAIVGSGIHGGAAVNFEQKISSGVDLSVKDIADAAVAAFDHRLEQGVLLTEDEMGVGKNKVFGRARDETRRLAEFHAKVVAPEYQPIAVEQPIRLELPRSSHDLLGVLDVVVEGDRVVDFKTAGKKKPDSDAHVSVQLTAYAVLFKKEYGKLPEAMRLDYAVRGGAKFTRVVVETTRGVKEVEAFAARLGAFTRIVRAGAYAPADPRSWFCYSMDTEMLTQRGWLGYEQLRLDDSIATMNPLTMLIEWQQPTRIFKKPWGLPMIAYHGRCLRWNVTPDHRMLVRSSGRSAWRFVNASDVERKCSIGFPVAAQAVRPGVPLTDDMISLSGWMSAEGHFRTDDAIIEISQNTDWLGWPAIASLLTRLGLRYSINRPQTRAAHGAFRILTQDARWIRESIQSSKAPPAWLWDADPRQFRVWLSAFCAGDGGAKDGGWAVGQKDEAAIDAVQA